MSIKTYIKRCFQYVFKGMPKVYANVAVIAPNEMLKNRTALITGGTSGIGFEIAKAFINAGANAVITSRNQEKIDRACLILGEKAKGIVWDCTDIKSIEQKFETVLNLFGRIDILVNNAGVVGGEIKDCDEIIYNQILDTNLKATFFMSQTFGKYFKENNIKGNILNIGSSSSLRPATSAYTVSKWGICGLTRGLAKVLAPYGITVNGLAPGPTATPMLMPNGIKDDISFPNPLGRFILPQEIANMAVFLVAETGRAIIGDMVFMTGGSGIVTYDDVEYKF